MRSRTTLFPFMILLVGGVLLAGSGCVRPFTPITPLPLPLTMTPTPTSTVPGTCVTFQPVTLPAQDFNGAPLRVIRDASDWSSYLTTSYPASPSATPPVVLGSSMIIAYAQRYSSACMDAVTFTSVCYFPNRVEVTLDFVPAGFDANCNPLACAMVYGLTSTKAIEVPFSSLPVSFIVNGPNCSWSFPTPTPDTTCNQPVPLLGTQPVIESSGVTALMFSGNFPYQYTSPLVLHDDTECSSYFPGAPLCSSTDFSNVSLLVIHETISCYASFDLVSVTQCAAGLKVAYRSDNWSCGGGLYNCLCYPYARLWAVSIPATPLDVTSLEVVP